MACILSRDTACRRERWTSQYASSSTTTRPWKRGELHRRPICSVKFASCKLRVLSLQTVLSTKKSRRPALPHGGLDYINHTGCLSLVNVDAISENLFIPCPACICMWELYNFSDTLHKHLAIYSCNEDLIPTSSPSPSSSLFPPPSSLHSMFRLSDDTELKVKVCSYVLLNYFEGGGCTIFHV